MPSARIFVLAAFLACWAGAIPVCAQQDNGAPNSSQEQKDRDSARETEMSSSKDTRIDLSAPADDAKTHPESGPAVMETEDAGGVQDFKPWDPHKAAKDIEVGDFYFKKKNYRAALDRYKEALTFKPNDAIANFRAGQCEEKVSNSQEAVTYYEAYLKIMPHGPFAADAQKAIDHLRGESKSDSPK